LKRFDAEYFKFYPYLAQYVPANELHGKDLLEIGLGYGTFGQYLAEQGCRYHGLDIAEGPVRMMRYRLGMLGVERPELQASQGSALDTPYSSEQFDYVVSIGCLHHTGDLARSIDEVYRVLRPGGIAVIMIYNAHSFRRMVKSPLVGLASFLRAGPRHWLEKWRERERALYDTNASGDAAPHTDFTSIRAARRLFGRFESVNIDKQNADPLLYPIQIPRPYLLNNLGRWLGLDLYIRARKSRRATNDVRRANRRDARNAA
jgi:SAM-dependent methyltransferase